MHPLLTRASRVVLYLAAWIDVGLLLAAFLRMVTPRPWTDAIAFAVPAALLEGFIVLSAWWVCREYRLSGALLSRSIGAQVAAIVVASAVWTVLAAALAAGLARWAGLGPPPEAVRRDLGIVFASGTLFYLLSLVAHHLSLAVRTSHAAERAALGSEVAAREAELRALRAQLNPHFLFNSLNSINALVGSDPEAARQMCERLGDFLRRTLALGARDSVTLGDELALVDRYLDIEHVRFGDRLQVELDVGPGAAACLVPPLLLQPLVENAVKHGVQDCIDGGVIRLAARREQDRLVLAVDNPVDPEAPSRRGAGVGLANVRRRLEVFGAQGARLETAREAGRYRVTLTLPAQNGDAHA
jgi:hypothetical protein